MMKSIITVAAVVLCCYLCSCNIINPVEKVPTYLRLDSLKVTSTEMSRTGSTSSKLSSAWVYQDNNLVGVFDVPSNVPILLDQRTTIRIAGGVSLNGLRNLQEMYPFYTFDTVTIDPAPGKRIPHVGTLEYTPTAKVQVVCDFETGNTFRKVNYDYLVDTTIVRTADKSKVFEGGGAGYIYLDSKHPSSENINTPDNFYKIPGTSKAYIELNYKCDIDFEVGIQAGAGGNVVVQYPVIIKPSENWNKMYVTLESFVGTYQASAYRVMLKAKLPDGKADGYVLVDNIKIVSY